MSDASDRTQGPAEVKVGTVLVSLLDPDHGQEVAFHRWYERDHFFSGCMVGEHFFSGRRYVATRGLKDVRLPAQGAMLADPRAGSYLALYWILAGHHDEAQDWATVRVKALHAHDRMFSMRKPVHAGFYAARFVLSHDPDGVPIELALEHPYAGVGLTMLEAAESVGREQLADRLERELLPPTLSPYGPSLCLATDPLPIGDDMPAYVERPKGLERRILLFTFHPEDPARTLPGWARALGERVEGAGLGRLLLSAPFIPTIPGSDRYADDLW
ncbi:MAG: hypothetical protein R3F35_09025 [Myxococcota bacterium]